MTDGVERKRGHTHTPTHMHIDLNTVIIPMFPQQSKESPCFLCPICSLLKYNAMSAMFFVTGPVSGLYKGKATRR